MTHKPSQYLFLGALAGFVLGILAWSVRDKLRYRNEPWDVRLYAPNAADGLLIASDDSPAINCKDRAAEGLVCMSKDHFGELVSKFRGYRAACPAPAP